MYKIDDREADKLVSALQKDVDEIINNLSGVEKGIVDIEFIKRVAGVYRQFIEGAIVDRVEYESCTNKLNAFDVHGNKIWAYDLVNETVEIEKPIEIKLENK